MHAVPAVSSADWENCSITVDLVLEANGKARPNLAYFGVWGAIGSPDPMPFLLNRNGSIDFGSGFEDNERYARTNLLDKVLETGEYFTFLKEGEITLRLLKISDLTE